MLDRLFFFLIFYNSQKTVSNFKYFPSKLRRGGIKSADVSADFFLGDKYILKLLVSNSRILKQLLYNINNVNSHTYRSRFNKF